jgi:hypothetical protein
MKASKQGLKPGAKLCLFLVSYAPLFLILCVKQLYKHREFLNWGGINREAISLFLKLFGFVSILALLSLVGGLGLWMLVQNVNKRTITNGDVVTINDIDNRNSESISYLFTYLIPFVFQDLSNPVDVASLLILLATTFLIYTNSSMLLVNPTISMWYSLYDIRYTEEATKLTKKGFILCREKLLDEGDLVRIKRLGHRLYFAVPFKV